MTKIAINGFGRIGRLFFRQAFSNPQLEIVAINDLGNLENLAYLLKYDSVYRTYERQVTSDKEKGELIVDGKRIKFFQEKDPLKLPWKDLDIDIVVESTGAFESFEKAKAHLDAGAKKVVITAPAKDAEGTAGGRTIFVGLNDDELKNIKLSTNASCTTNAAYPVIAIMSENPGIQKAVLNTVHAYTATQTIVDSPVKGDDLRRGRAGAQNIVPSTTGAAIAVTRVLKDLENKFDGISLRVPIVSGSIADITFLSKRKTSVEEINEIFKKAAKEPRWQGILKTIDEPIVSSDIIAEPYGAIVDLKFTKVVDEDLVKVLAWYDNEWGYCAILLKHVLKAAETLSLKP
ncbi:type I glyceraldehyde-3-phosphate dehydrogenase [Candidatus Wolfebacteria bacterium]|nr:type I glyceraldehyde-3-phosphate dehydrogenase [Candidatus Wolfebacteria bacterium]